MISIENYVHPIGVPCNYGYMAYVPKGKENEKGLPLVVFLHGAGERGDNVELVAVHGPLKRVRQGAEFPFICVAPQCPKDSFWPIEAKTLALFIDAMVEKYSADKRRIYVTGLSMGGFGTWTLGLAYPDKFAALIPICGAGVPWAAGAMKDVPTWAFHGDKDEAVDVSGSIDMVNGINTVGGNAKLTVYPGVGHDSWTVTYEDEKVYEWMLAQSKK